MYNSSKLFSIWLSLSIINLVYLPRAAESLPSFFSAGIQLLYRPVLLECGQQVWHQYRVSGIRISVCSCSSLHSWQRGWNQGAISGRDRTWTKCSRLMCPPFWWIEDATKHTTERPWTWRPCIQIHVATEIREWQECQPRGLVFEQQVSLTFLYSVRINEPVDASGSGDNFFVLRFHRFSGV